MSQTVPELCALIYDHSAQELIERLRMSGDGLSRTEQSYGGLAGGWLDDRPGGCSPDNRAAPRRCYAEPMNDSKRSLRGRVGAPDRVQRLVIGLILMGLNVAGLMLHPE